MPTLESVRINWQQAVQLATIVAALASFAFMLQNGLHALDGDVRRIELELKNERTRREAENNVLTTRIERMQSEATSERLRQIELLTELRTDVRQMRVVFERLAGSPPR